jgi:hypothetical protein
MRGAVTLLRRDLALKGRGFSRAANSP